MIKLKANGKYIGQSDGLRPGGIAFGIAGTFILIAGNIFLNSFTLTHEDPFWPLQIAGIGFARFIVIALGAGFVLFGVRFGVWGGFHRLEITRDTVKIIIKEMGKERAHIVDVPDVVKFAIIVSESGWTYILYTSTSEIAVPHDCVINPYDVITCLLEISPTCRIELRQNHARPRSSMRRRIIAICARFGRPLEETRAV